MSKHCQLLNQNSYDLKGKHNVLILAQFFFFLNKKTRANISSLFILNLGDFNSKKKKKSEILVQLLNLF